MLELTMDPDALAAIEDLIRQTRDRLSKMDEAEHPNPNPNPLDLRPAPEPRHCTLRPVTSKVELAKFCKTHSDIYASPPVRNKSCLPHRQGRTLAIMIASGSETRAAPPRSSSDRNRKPAAIHRISRC
jgi:hypothetical protein